MPIYSGLVITGLMGGRGEGREREGGRVRREGGGGEGERGCSMKRPYE